MQACHFLSHALCFSDSYVVPRLHLQVTLLLRDPYLCKDINELHCNTRYLKVGDRHCRRGVVQGTGMAAGICACACMGTYRGSLPSLQDHLLPPNVSATTSAAEAIAGAQLAIHAVPVQHSRAFLLGIKASGLGLGLPVVTNSAFGSAGGGKLCCQNYASGLAWRAYVSRLPGTAAPACIGSAPGETDPSDHVTVAAVDPFLSTAQVICDQMHACAKSCACGAVCVRRAVPVQNCRTCCHPTCPSSASARALKSPPANS